MGNCNCLERARAKVTAWGAEEGDGGEDEFWGATAAEFSGGGGGGARGGVPSTRKKEIIKDGGGGGKGSSSPTRRVKIRMTKGQLRRLLAGAGRGAAVEDVVAEIMSMGRRARRAREGGGGQRRPPAAAVAVQAGADTGRHGRVAGAAMEEDMMEMSL
ncbi:hypothetical protein OsJ_24540 [Oryza sativa Japonica Group]|uniref:Uncharacterized protein n=1 Tax=Oryza sativa subsp. japonica TaxID=39947 RepID=A3BKK8_ORYSJ|nr:hypothetical protein OsJ_24540 [Oryza sativa Japonica Group]